MGCPAGCVFSMKIMPNFIPNGGSMKKQDIQKTKGLYIPKPRPPEPKTDRKYQAKDCDEAMYGEECDELYCDECMFAPQNLKQYVKWRKSNES